MATTKKPTETAEQVQADNSRAEAVKAENEAAEKPTAPVYRLTIIRTENIQYIILK